MDGEQNGTQAQQQSGKTGLPNAGTSTDSGKQLKHFMAIAGVDDSE